MTRRVVAAGFTLLELLIAMAIFAIVSMLAYGGLRSVQTTSEGVREAGAKLAELQTGFLVLGRDIEQSIDRPIRDAFGQAQPAFVGARGAVGEFLEFTRGGWRNPAGFARSHLQRVGYALQDDKLVRLTWNALDRSYGAEPQERVLIAGVKSVTARYLDQDRQWQDQWPKLQTGDAAPAALPIAVEVTMEVDGWGIVQRLYRVAGEAPPQINTVAPAGGVPATDSERRKRGLPPPEEPPPDDPDNGGGVDQ